MSQGCAKILSKSHLSDNGQGADLPSRAHRLTHFVQVGEGLENEQINPGTNQRLYLFVEDSTCNFGPKPPQRGHLPTRRPYRPGDKHWWGQWAICPAHFLNSTPRQLYTPVVDLSHSIVQAMFAQPETIGAKGIGLDDLGASFNVGAVRIDDHVRLDEIQFIEASIRARPLSTQQGTHRAIE
jgi:hypothetical protein